MKKPAKTNEPQTGGTLEPLTDERSHTECFAKAAKLFSQGEFAKARDIFQRAAHGPVLSVNESASMYVRMCEQRLDRQRQETATPEELYNRGMALLKQRRWRRSKPRSAPKRPPACVTRSRWPLETSATPAPPPGTSSAPASSTPPCARPPATMPISSP
jgi:hypothetical protein